MALLAGYVIMAHTMRMYTKQSSDTAYMEIVYPISRQASHFRFLILLFSYHSTPFKWHIFSLFCSMFSLLFLHFFLYGCNIFTWRKARINYSFIFELAPTKELEYRDVFLICTASMTAVIGVLFIHLSLIAKGYSSRFIHAIPGFLLLVIHQILSVNFGNTATFNFGRMALFQFWHCKILSCSFSC